MNDPIATIPTAELFRMRDAAYREAVRSWSEYRAAGGWNATSSRILLEAAQSAEDYWRHLSGACKERGQAPQDDPGAER